jgi:hypothetical protein
MINYKTNELLNNDTQIKCYVLGEPRDKHRPDDKNILKSRE